MGENLELLTEDRDAIAAKVAENLGALLHRNGTDATSSELVYSPLGAHSYYRDLIATQTGRVQSPGARERLARHGEQMDRIGSAREARAWERLRHSSLEYRVTPDRTPGSGGYFAPPGWLDQLFVTANRPGRVLAGLMPRFGLPPGVSSVNVPVIGTGTSVAPAADDATSSDTDFTDSAGTSAVVPLAGRADVSLQLFEQSPPGAHLDWAIFQDLSEGYDYDLESQLIIGTGGRGANVATAQLPGVLSIPGIVSVAYTSGTPTGTALWPTLSKVAAQVGDARLRAPQCWLMRTARWFWIQGAEDATANRPFGLSTQFFLGSDDDTPDPVSGIMGLPVFLSDAIPASFGGATGLTVGAGTQDVIIAVRPHDQILLEGSPRTLIDRDRLSGSLGVGLHMHCNVAAITGRRPAGIGVLQGTGMSVQAGY